MSLNDGLIGAWVPTLGNSGAVLLDRSTTRAPADIGGMTWVTQSPYKPVLFNGGSSTYATVAANRRFRRSFPLSFAGWFRFIGLGTSRALFNTSLRPTGNFAGFGAAALTTGALQIGYGDNGGTSATVNQRLFTTSASLLATGQWYHLAGVFYDHLVADTWVDGVLRANTQSGTGGAVVHNANNMSIGGGNVAGGSTLNGYVAELRLWNRALYQGEIEGLFHGGPGFGLAEPDRRVWRVAHVPAGATVTGTVAVTIASATSNASGSLVYSGIFLSTSEPATSTGTGTQTFSGSVSSSTAASTGSATGAVANPRTGVVIAFAHNSVASASGAQVFSGLCSSSTAAAICEAVGAGDDNRTGTVAVSTGAVQASGFGALRFAGSSGAGVSSSTASAAGQLSFIGAANPALAPAHAVATGQVLAAPITGYVSATLAAATCAAVGTVPITAAPAFAVRCNRQTQAIACLLRARPLLANLDTRRARV